MLRAAARTLAIALAAATSFPLAGQEAPLFTKDFPADEFAARRAKVMDAIGKDGVALVQGAPSPPGYTRFRQSNELYYLSGIESPHAYLLIDGGERRATLYLPHRNEARERSEGKLLSAEDADEIKQCAGVDAVFGSDLLAEQLARQARGGTRSLYTPSAPPEGFATSRDLASREVADVGSDPFDGGPSRPARLRRLIQERFPRFEIKDLTPTLDALRLIKSPREIALIKRATRLSGLAILEAMRSTAPGIHEHELDAVAKYVFYRNGAQGEAYYSQIASGPNAWFPHYNAGRRELLDGELLLMDFAPDVGYYMSDVTRMWPVNGRFTSAQRELYGFYLACYRSILQAIRPGVTAPSIKQEAAAQMEKLLASATFQRPAYASAAREFVKGYKDSAARGGLGHWVGMATHDVGSDAGPLRAGMVFTIEPALRVPEERLYIRLEDLIVIGEQKAEVVSEWLPLDVDAIEKVMREEGMLQRYPKDRGQ